MAVSRRLAELRLELRFLMRRVVWFRLVVRLGLKIFRDHRGKQLALTALANVTLDEFARIRRLEADAAVTALVTLRCILIFGVPLADLSPPRRLQESRGGCGAERKSRASECHTRREMSRQSFLSLFMIDRP